MQNLQKTCYNSFPKNEDTMGNNLKYANDYQLKLLICLTEEGINTKNY